VETEQELTDSLKQARQLTETFCLLGVRLGKMDRSPALERLASRLAKRLQ